MLVEQVDELHDEDNYQYDREQDDDVEAFSHVFWLTGVLGGEFEGARCQCRAWTGTGLYECAAK